VVRLVVKLGWNLGIPMQRAMFLTVVHFSVTVNGCNENWDKDVASPYETAKIMIA
jgi:hypothetical protein